MSDYSAWIGRTRDRTERLDARLVQWMAAALDRPALMRLADGGTLPACWHWLYFVPVEPRSKLGRDGHPEKGDFLPPTEQPRRMWAGSRLRWHGDFRIGATVDLRSTILSCESKQGRTGPMTFVCVGHRYSIGGEPILDEEHDIVYRDDAPPAEREALARTAARARQGSVVPERAGTMMRTVTPDPTLLFRYSAVTFNGHRIHYDRDYAREVEGYPGLVVHGPLIATLLLDFLVHDVAPGARLAEYTFRAKRPTFDVGPFALHGEPPDAEGRVALWSTNHAGEVGLEAQARIVA